MARNYGVTNHVMRRWLVGPSGTRLALMVLLLGWIGDRSSPLIVLDELTLGSLEYSRIPYLGFQGLA